MGNETDRRTLLAHYDAAVGRFEKVSTALRAALAGYPFGPELLDLVAAEERAREAVVLARARLVEFRHGNIDDTIPLRVLKPDHVCDRSGRAEKVIDETGDVAITGIYPTCSACGMPQLSGSDVTSAASARSERTPPR